MNNLRKCLSSWMSSTMFMLTMFILTLTYVFIYLCFAYKFYELQFFPSVMEVTLFFTTIPEI